MLALDPGDTTGWAIFDGGEFIQSGEHRTVTPGALANLIAANEPARVVCESYHIYGHKLNQHAGSDVPTLQLIGAVRLVCEQLDVPLAFQTAAQAKGFCSDGKLKSWGLWHPTSKHARDATRHGCYYLLFGREEK